MYMHSATDRYRAHIGIGALDARAGKFADARAHLETALHYNPAGDWGYLYLGGIAMEADNDYPKAIALFEKAISLSPVNDVARDYLGIALMNQGNTAGAAEQFREALKINPENPEAKAHLEIAQHAPQAPVPAP
jgi:tetratricopeptide (TPR) repeat protein